jgi:hypothetical protein
VISEGSKQPGLSLVADNAAREIEAQEAFGRVDYTVREMAANVMRIAAGSGDPVVLMRQAMDFFEATADCINLKADPNPTISTALGDRDWRRLFPKEYPRNPRPNPTEIEQIWLDAIKTIEQELLRMMAAQLTRNPSHESKHHGNVVRALTNFRIRFNAEKTGWRDQSRGGRT